MLRDDCPDKPGPGVSEALRLRCWVRLLAASIPGWAVAGAGIDLAGGVPGSAGSGQAAGHCKIPWFGHFAVAHSEAFAIAHDGVHIRLLIAGSEHAPVLGEHRRGNGG